MQSNQTKKSSFIYRKGLITTFVLVLALFFSINITSSAKATETDFEITESGYLIKYHGDDENVVIPNTVKIISYTAFTGNKNIVSVTIPNSVTEFEENDFEPIGAFYQCTNLQSINIPNSITYIPSGTFAGCTNLTSITIPNSVTHINQYAFCATGLKSIKIPNSVTDIGYGAFMSCLNLKSINIPNSVKRISIDTFFECENLTSVTISKKVTCVRYDTFLGTPWLKNKQKENPLVIVNGILIDGTTYKKTKVTIPNSVTTISSGAFSGCTNLKTITIPKSVTFIGESAFYGTPWLKNKQKENPLVIVNGILIDGTTYTKKKLTIPKSVKTIAGGAFSNCKKITSVIIPNSVTIIANSETPWNSGAFANCTNLKSITIPKSVKSISDYAFSDCSDKLVIKCKKNSTAHKYAKENNIKFSIE